MGSLLFSRREKYTIGILSILAFALRIPLALRPEQSLTVFPYGDDAYYVFSVARNLAAGRGISVDGIHLTNGFQPLIVLLYTPIFWLCGSDAWLAIRWTFILNGIIAAFTVWGIAHLIQVCERENVAMPFGLTAPVIGALLWSGSISIFAQTTNGLETGLYSLLLFLSLSIYAHLRRAEEAGMKAPIARWLLLGLMLGLAVLARIDAVILVTIIVIVELWRGSSWRAILAGGTALAVSTPWWIYNMVCFGSLMPISGQAENSWYTPVSANIYRLVQTLDDIALVLFYTPHDLSFFSRVLCSAAIILLLYLLLRHTHVILRLKKGMFLQPLLPMALFSFILILYYTFFFEAPHFILRYLQPLRMLWVILVAGSTPFIHSSYRQLHSRRRIVAQIGIAAFSIFSIGFGVERYCYRLHDTTGSEFYKMGLWATQHPAEKIAMLQSGIASFIAPNIINLDGKVNAAALRAHQEGRLAAYLRDENFTYIADWKPFIEDIAAITKKDELYFDSVGIIDKIFLMKRRTTTIPFIRTSTTPLIRTTTPHSK